MKGLLAIAIIASAIYIETAAMTKELDAKMKAVRKECKDEHHVDEATYNAMVTSHKIPSTEEGKCMIACFMKKMGYLKDKKFDLDAMKEANKQKWDNADHVEKANKLSEKCIKEVEESNECLLAARVATCFMEKASGEGLTIPILAE